MNTYCDVIDMQLEKFSINDNLVSKLTKFFHGLEISNQILQTKLLRQKFNYTFLLSIEQKVIPIKYVMPNRTAHLFALSKLPKCNNFNKLFVNSIPFHNT